jgi:hypothetical protein
MDDKVVEGTPREGQPDNPNPTRAPVPGKIPIPTEGSTTEYAWKQATHLEERTQPGVAIDGRTSSKVPIIPSSETRPDEWSHQPDNWKPPLNIPHPVNLEHATQPGVAVGHISHPDIATDQSPQVDSAPVTKGGPLAAIRRMLGH